MSSLEVWEKIALPIIQFLIGPIVAGYVVFMLNDKKNKNNEKDDRIRQMNIIRSKTSRAISFLELSNEDNEEISKVSSEIDDMENGDFTGITDVDFESQEMPKVFEDVLNQHYRMRETIYKNYEYNLNNFLLTIEEIKNLPKDKLPTSVHDKLVRILDKQNLDIDLEEYKKLVKEIDKLT